MWQYYSHFKYTMRHKYYVFIECAKERLFIRGIMHDMSKFTPEEFFAYADFFFYTDGSKKSRVETELNNQVVKDNFEKAFALHQTRNDHHWKAWIKPCGDGKFSVNKMSVDAATEMICDWIGAAKANGEFSDDLPLPWYRKNHKKLMIHSMTRLYIEQKMKFEDIDLMSAVMCMRHQD